MSLQPIDKLALRIYKGAKGLKLDKYPLVAIGAISNTFQPRTPSLVNEPEVWMLIHTQEYTLYSYFTTIGEMDCNVEICLFVPADMQLSVNDSPYGLLSKVFDCLRKQSHTGDVDAMPFEQLLTSCVLEERPDDISLPIMGGNNPASFCADSKAQVCALLRFSRYQQLSNIGHLEIGYQCNTTVTIPIKTLQKPKHFQEQKSEIDQRRNPTIRQTSRQTPNNATKKKTNKKLDLKGYLYVFMVIIIGFVGLLFQEEILGIFRQKMVLPIANEDSIQLETPKEAVKIQEAKDAAAKAERDKEEAAKKLQAAKKEETKAEILNLVNKKNLEACRVHWGWKKYLTQRERYAVEAVLNINQYRGVVKKNVENYLTDKTVFKNWDELMAVKREIEKIQNAGETGGK